MNTIISLLILLPFTLFSQDFKYNTFELYLGEGDSQILSTSSKRYTEVSLTKVDEEKYEIELEQWLSKEKHHKEISFKKSIILDDSSEGVLDKVWLFRSSKRFGVDGRMGYKMYLFSISEGSLSIFYEHAPGVERFVLIN